MSYSNAGLKAFPASETFNQYSRVKIDFTADPPSISKADAEDEAHGEAQAEATRVGQFVSVKLFGPVCIREAGGAITQYARVFEADDGKVDDAFSGGQAAGIALEAAAASGERIAVLEEPARGKFGGLRHAATADSTAVTASGAQTFDTGSKTLKGASLRVGDVIRVRAGVHVASTTGTETVTIKLLLGTEEIVTSGAVDVADDDIAWIDAEIVVRAVGASGAIAAYGVVALGVEGTVTAKPFRKDQATEDLSGDVAVSVTTTASSTGESVVLEHFTVEVLRK